MKTMIVSDYLNVRGALIQLLGISVVIGAFMTLVIGSTSAAAAAIAAMIPFMVMFTLASLDEKDGWERFRLTLPITRSQIVVGRYAFVGLTALAGALLAVVISWLMLAIVPLLPFNFVLDDEWGNTTIIAGAIIGGLSVVLLAISVTQPLIMRFGMTKATRIAPMVLVIVICIAISVLGNSFEDTEFIRGIIQWLDTGNNYLVLAAVIVVFDVLVYALSALAAVKLYAKRVL